MSNESARADARAAAIDAAIAGIRAVAGNTEIDAGSLGRIKQILIGLAGQRELFPLEDFPPPTASDSRRSCLYRVAEDADHRFALYVNSAAGEFSTPAHNHTTWAVIVGIQGEEHNRFYRRADADGASANGVEQTGGEVVQPGTGVAFQADDLHSIHIKDDGPVLNFHMYGLALEQLHRREYYSAKEGQWQVFPAHSDIREARAGQAA